MAPGTERSNATSTRALRVFSVVGATSTLLILDVHASISWISCSGRNYVVAAERGIGKLKGETESEHGSPPGERNRCGRSRLDCRTNQALAAAFAALRIASYWGSVAISLTYSTCLTLPSLPTTKTARAVRPASGPSLMSTP